MPHITSTNHTTALASVIVAIPIHNKILTEDEYFSLSHSIKKLEQNNRHICFITPDNIDLGYLQKLFKNCSNKSFPSEYFISTETYSQLLVQSFFYENFSSFEFILILQPDAIIFRDELDYWCLQPYDYLGAPWFDGYEFSVNLDRFGGQFSRRVRMHVGNGGLSLRRIKKCIDLINEFPEASQAFYSSKSNEDFYFSLLGSLSNNFILPNEIIASRFSMEHRPDYYLTWNGGHLPMGSHGWAKLHKDFWLSHIPDLNI